MSEQKQPLRYAGRILKAREVANILRVQENTVRVWIRSGLLEAELVPVPGGRPAYRIRGEEVDKLLQGKEHEMM